ncbi:MAG TPA: alpha/beta hydrolase [Fibrobacteria bacterium]|mgnify:CR=1 FL=1|nr:alpha/beta hydrolase [Fibrobacteria bacterium]HOX51434.1 alpha/beta hydrolase [Fibrobacteria bacterium]
MKTQISGKTLAWTEAGAGIPLVLVHGLPFQRGMWAPQLPVLGRKCRVLALDLPGFGESDLSSAPPSLDAWADDLASMVAHWKCGPVVLAGHSMGGYLALAFARRHPDLLRGLVMVASRATADSADAAANRRSVAARLRSESPEFVAQSMLPRMVDSTNPSPDLVRSARELMNPLRAEGIAWAQLALADRIDSSNHLPTIRVPTLVVAGEHDAVVPLEETGIMAAQFAKGRLEVVEKAGHLPSFEQPKAFNSIMERWLDHL